MSIRKTLTGIILASAIGLVGCGNEKNISHYTKINGAKIVLEGYNRQNVRSEYRLKVTEGEVIWTYVDRDGNGTVDYVKREEKEGGPFSYFERNKWEKMNSFQRCIFLNATKNYNKILDEIKEKINSEQQSQL